MIFAAGFGTRMGHLTASRPKPLVAVAGKPLIDYALNVAFSAGSETVLVNTHYLAEQIAAHLSERNDVVLQHEDARILDTGGGLKRAAATLGRGPVFTLNSDAVWRGPNPLSVLADGWDSTQMQARLLLLHRDQIPGYGGKNDFALGADGRISRDGPYIYLGAQIINAGIVANHPGDVFSLNAVWDDMMQRGAVFGAEYTGSWCDVGTPEAITRAEEMLGV